ncbi:MAG: DNA polymerase III subunit delta' [Caldilineales bacterium]|nr:DNA polymerase III subunit delta' [Caldilineales bacterium]
MNHPQRLRVYGHEWAQDLLRTAVLGGRTSHAYLFTGPEQVGKTTLARSLAQALTCAAPEDEGVGACGRCRSCRLAAGEGHPDHHLIEPGGTLKVEAVRDVIREAQLSPVEAPYKVFILCEFDRATAAAANALLKTLEEPSATTRLLLTSSRPAGLLPTIVSRCQVLNLRPVPTATIAAALQDDWGVAPEQAALLAGLSGGRPGWAITAVSRPETWERYRRYLADMESLLQQNGFERMQYAARLAGDAEVETVLQSWLLWWRDVLLVQQNCLNLILHRDHLPTLREVAGRIPSTQVRRFLQALLQTATYLRQTVNAQLALEALLLKAPQMG